MVMTSSDLHAAVDRATRLVRREASLREAGRHLEMNPCDGCRGTLGSLGCPTHGRPIVVRTLGSTAIADAKPRVVIGDPAWAVFRENMDADVVEMTTVPDWAAQAIYDAGRRHDATQAARDAWVAEYNAHSRPEADPACDA